MVQTSLLFKLQEAFSKSYILCLKLVFTAIHNLQKLRTAFPVAFISMQLLIFVVVQVIPASNLENAMNFAREIICLYYKYRSGVGFFFC